MAGSGICCWPLCPSSTELPCAPLAGGYNGAPREGKKPFTELSEESDGSKVAAVVRNPVDRLDEDLPGDLGS